jgi:hypothetical protein
MTPNAGPWIATFRDGPLATHDQDRIFSVGPIRQGLYLMPNPGHDESWPWVLVGFDDLEPVEPWPGQVHYRLADVVTMAGADCEPVAYYVLDAR